MHGVLRIGHVRLLQRGIPTIMCPVGSDDGRNSAQRGPVRRTARRSFAEPVASKFGHDTRIERFRRGEIGAAASGITVRSPASLAAAIQRTWLAGITGKHG